MGEVWKVLHVRTRQHYALKTLRTTKLHDGRTIRRFLQEAKIAAAIDSPNVVRVVDVKPDYVHQGESLPFIVMELANGPNLAQVLEVRQRTSFAELLWILEEVGQALRSAHALGIVHRDLKPSNIVLCRAKDGVLTAKLCDFGIAKIQRTFASREDSVPLLSTESGVLFGTPLYMAPEQLMSSGAIVPATDQWAVGVLAFRCIAGRDYFDRARNGAEIVLAIVHDALRPPSEMSEVIPRAFDEWFLRSCARDSRRRFPDVTAQVAALKAALGNVSPTPPDLHQIVSPARDASPANTARESQRTLAPRIEPTSVTSATSWRYSAIVASAILAVLGTNWLGGAVHARIKSAAAPEFERAGRIKASAAQPLGSSEAYAFNSFECRTEGPQEQVVDRTLVGLAGSSAAPATQRPQARPKTTPPAAIRRKLPLGASCTRSAQCSKGICLAEICQ